MMAGEDKKGIALLRELGMEEDNAPLVAQYLKKGGDPDLCVEYELMPESPIRRLKPRLIKLVCRGDKDNTFQALAMHFPSIGHGVEGWGQHCARCAGFGEREEGRGIHADGRCLL